MEDLAVGDLVNTRDNGPQRLRWIGTRTVDARGKFAPIRFEAGAIGNNRALEVSPQHRILITSWQAEILFGAKEVLVAAKFLVNGNTIRAVPRDNVTYIHLLFDQHEIVISEGVPSESYHIAHAFAPDEEAVREELLALFPELFSQRGANMQTVRKVLRSYEAALLRAA